MWRIRLLMLRERDGPDLESSLLPLLWMPTHSDELLSGNVQGANDEFPDRDINAPVAWRAFDDDR